jgi:hypothetical protein
MRTSSFPLLAAAASLLAVTPHTARAQRFELGLGGGFYTLSGNDFEGVDAGMGVEVAGRLRLPGGLQIGLALQRNSHGADFVDDDIAVTAVMLDSRYAFRVTGSNLEPFLGARAGRAQRSAEVSDIDVSSGGFLFGVLGGLALPVSRTVNLEFAASLYQVSFGEAKADGYGTIDDTDASGTSLGLRVGVNIRFGGGAEPAASAAARTRP